MGSFAGFHPKPSSLVGALGRGFSFLEIQFFHFRLSVNHEHLWATVVAGIPSAVVAGGYYWCTCFS